jgi:hypothetical protein
MATMAAFMAGAIWSDVTPCRFWFGSKKRAMGALGQRTVHDVGGDRGDAVARLVGHQAETGRRGERDTGHHHAGDEAQTEQQTDRTQDTAG